METDTSCAAREGPLEVSNLAGTAPHTLPESMIPTPRSSGTGHVSTASATFVNVQPRLEEPKLGGNEYYQIGDSDAKRPVYMRDSSHELGTTPPHSNHGGVLSESAPDALCGTVAAVAPSTPATRRSNSEGHRRGISGENKNPSSSLRLSFPDYETTVSNHYFLSEPSLSAEDDESRIRAPHRLPVGGGGRVFRRQFSSDEDGAVPNGHHNPPRVAQYSPVPSSPGNTSLSSWESPSRSKNRVLLQFTPSAFRTGTSSSHPSNAAEIQPHAASENPGDGMQQATSRGRSPDRSSTLYTPPSLEKHTRSQMDNEASTAEHAMSMPSLNEVQQTVYPELTVKTGADAPVNGAVESPNAFQRMIHGLKDTDSTSGSLVFDHSPRAADDTGLESPPNSLPRRRINGHHHNLADESIIMDLSDSEEEMVAKSKHIHNKTTGDGPSESERHHSRAPTFDSDYMLEHAADDEKTTTNSKEPEVDNDKKPQYTRQTRARSGDAAAATLATGGRDWKGMKMDNIPLPPDEDDDDEDDAKEVKNKQQSQPLQASRNLASPVTFVQHQTKPDVDSSFSRDNDSSDSDNDNDYAFAVNGNNIQHRRMSKPQHQVPSQQQRRPSLTRPPKPEIRVPAPPSQVQPLPSPPSQLVPPPPGMYPTDPNQNVYHASNGYGKQYPSSPPVFTQQQSPFLSSHKMWTPTPPTYNMTSRNGFVPHSYPSAMNLPPRWDGNHQHKAIGESANGRERFSSWEDPRVAEAPYFEDRRHSWQTEHRRSSVRSLQSVALDQESLQDDNASQRDGIAVAIDNADVASLHNSIASHRNSICVDDEEELDNFDEEGPIPINSQLSAERLDVEQHIDDGRNFPGSYQKVMLMDRAPLGSPFSNIGKAPEGKFNRASFYPNTSLAAEDERQYPTFICPRCKTRQRAFFGVANAPKQLEGPTSYLALYFVLYVTASLFIFGLEEGWEPLDCIYFAVISLTTAGLGDFVPTTDVNKLICSIFIYFGIACIGLLLGSYIANMLDDKADTDARAKQADSCPNCARIQNLKDAAERRHNRLTPLRNVGSRAHKSQNLQPMSHFQTERGGSPGSFRSAVYTPRRKHQHGRYSNERRHQQHRNNSSWADKSLVDLPGESSPPPPPPPPPAGPPQTSVPPPVHPFYGSSPQFSVASPQVSSKKLASPVQANILGSPMTRQILGRQSHTRHASFDIGLKKIFGDPGGTSGSSNGSQARKAVNSTPYRTPHLNEELSEVQIPVHSSVRSRSETFSNHESARSSNDHSMFNESSDDVGESSDNETSSVSTVDQIVDERLYKIKAAKYVILTLQGALGNSLVILAVGCVGFYLIENITLVDSWYFTTVLLTTTGYGDIVPVTQGGKLFATVYLLVGGTILLHNMSKISMIPLELRKRRIERAVLTQFGDSLDDDALRELATGPLIKRLSLTADRSDGLAECTREMFALAMLVRLGKVSEDDIRQTFAAFKRLDHNNEGVLNSKSIIAGMIHRRRSVNPLSSGNIQRDMQRVQQTEINRARQHAEMQSQNRLPSSAPNRSMRRFFFGTSGTVNVSPPQGEVRFSPHSTPPEASAETTALLHQAISSSYDSRTMHSGASPGSHHHLLHQHQASPLLHSAHHTSPMMSPYEGAY